MLEVALNIYSPEGTRRIAMSGDRLLIGRAEADAPGAEMLAINDDGISRRQASINRDGDRLWVLDEGSTNGTFLNGREVPPIGAALRDKDEIFVGNATTIRIEVCAAQESQIKTASDAPAASAVPSPSAVPPASASRATPILIACIVGVVALVAVAALASYAFGNRSAMANKRSIQRRTSAPVAGFDDAQNAPEIPANASAITPLSTPPADSTSSDSPFAIAPAPLPTFAPLSPAATASAETDAYRGKRYLQMTPEEQMAFIEARAQHISMMMGNRSYAFTDDVLHIIKRYVDGYASRADSNSTRLWGEGLRTLYGRASKFAPNIIRAFNARGVSPVVGLYIAMIETEYHTCLVSPVGAKGLFQFMPSTARGYGVDPDERCDVGRMAPAAAHYLADRIGEFGPDSMSVALAIAGYNRSPDSVRRDLRDVLNSENKERSFWTLVANSNKLDHWFQRENVKYVPKFFAAAIVGETPEAFGLDMRKLSSYTTISESAPPAAPVEAPAPSASPAATPITAR